MDAERYPLDFDALDKGDVITTERIEGLTGVAVTSARYAHEQVKLMLLIKRELRARGKLVTVRKRKGEIHILEDPNASAYNAQKFDKVLWQLVGVHVDEMCVDVSKLDIDEARRHERRMLRQSRLIGAIATVKPRVALQNHNANMPGLPAPIVPPEREGTA